MITATQKAHIHPIHPFPARKAPSIVWDCIPKNSGPLRILDPMSGSGTTLVCAREKGHFALGCDTDPLAILISRAWCSDIEPEKVKKRAILVLDEAKKLAKKMDFRSAYPESADEETRNFIDFWFDKYNRRQLTVLSTCIERVDSETERLFLWCALSRLIITKSVGVSLAMDVSHSRPHKVYTRAPILVFDRYLESVDYVVKRSPFKIGIDKRNLPPAEVIFGDARFLPIETNSIEIIVTSPPYLNAIDYLRGHKFTLVWMGYSIKAIREIRANNIGSERINDAKMDCSIENLIEEITDIETLDNRQIGILKRFVNDMNNVIKECARVIKKDGHVVFVIGDSSIKGAFVKNSRAIIRLATTHGLSLIEKKVRPIAENKRYLPPPNLTQSGQQLQRRMREEIILKFVAK
jgi:DNA modification methylase